ncbi:MAG TPA: WHG domain-containing protein [Humibacter sp.]|nr:WHG domain-containing protein [Humibacter sp.]
MPTPQRTTRDQIVHEALAIVAEGGLERLTMQAVADRVGVRAPSLYKRVRGRSQLVGLVVEAASVQLGKRLEAAVAADAEPREALRSLGEAFRSFAHERPDVYALMFTRLPPDSRPSPDVLRAASAPVLRVATALAGEHDALEAARTLTAWAHGFVDMELAGAFQLGGDPGRAYRYGLERIADALGARLRDSVNDG